MAFDAQCDLAAVVYGADDDPDALLTAFAADLCGLGRRVVGVIQVGRNCRSENPRFGAVVLPDGELVPSEAEGRGLAGVIVRALEADLPVLIAVPEHRFAALIKFSDGMNVRLACRRDALDRWWRSLGGPAVRRPGGGARIFCEVAK